MNCELPRMTSSDTYFFISKRFQLQSMKMPGSSTGGFSEENLREYVRHFTTCVWHCVGTCKMGTKDDETTVVGPDLR